MNTHSTHPVRIAMLAILMWATGGVASAGPAKGTYAGRLPFFGSFPSDTHLTNGYISLRVTAKGGVSGSISFAGYLYRMKGELVGGVLGPIAIPHRTGPGIVFAITASDETKIEGTVHREGQEPVVFSQNHALSLVPAYTSASPFPNWGLYTVGLDHVKSAWSGEMHGADQWDHDDFLGEKGFGLMQIYKTGRAIIRGRLPNGATYTSSTRATAFGPQGFEVWVYAIASRGSGSAVGYIQSLLNYSLPTEIPSPDAPLILNGAMRWYPDRFTFPERSWLVATGSEYNPPAPGEPILDILPDEAISLLPEETGGMGGPGLGGTVTQKNFWGPGGGMNHSNLFATIGGAPAVTNPLTRYGVVMGPYSGIPWVGPGPWTVDVDFTVKTGGFKVTFTHPGTFKRTIGYGAIIQHRGDYSPGFIGGILPGFGYGVFTNIVIMKNRTSVSYPGWIHLAPSSGTATGPFSGPALTLSGNLSFGNKTIGTVTRRTMQIRNSGDTPMLVKSVRMPSPVFSGSFQGVLLPGAVRSVDVTFRPRSARSYRGNVIVHASAGNSPRALAISGVGRPR